MNNPKKLLKVSTALSMFFLCGVALSTAFNNSLNVTNATATEETSVEKTYSAEDFADEVELGSDFLGASIKSATVTDTSAALSFTFRSTTLVGYKDVRGSYVVRVDDVNFTGDESKPVPEGYDRLNEEGNPILDGTIVSITGYNSTKTKGTYIPAKLKKPVTTEGADYKEFEINVTKIAEGTISAEGTSEFENRNSWSQAGLKKVFIPSSITEAETGAFSGLPADVVIEFEANEIPSTFEANWIDNLPAKQVLYGGEFASGISDKVTQQVTLKDEFNRPINYIAGYQSNNDYPTEEYNKPLVFQYDVYTEGSEVPETIYYELPISSEYNPYDQITKEGYGVSVNLTIEHNQEIDYNSFIFHNIFVRQKLDPKKIYSPDLTQGYFVKAKPIFKRVSSIDELVKIEESHISTFLGYTLFALKMDTTKVTTEANPTPHSLYEDVKTSIFETNRNKIESGLTRIRYSIYNLANTSFYFEYIGDNGEIKSTTFKITTPIDYQELTKETGNNVSLLVNNSDIAPDFSADKITKFSILDLYIQMDLVATNEATGTTSILSNSSILYRFGNVNVYDKELGTVPSTFDFNIVLILVVIGYLVIFCGVATALYFILKEKFKNDEFRRMNTKKYLKNAGIGLFGGSLIVLSIFFIILRTTGLNNSFVVFNPVDPFVIGFTIAAAIALGYFIVLLIKTIKAEMHRKEIVRLKLNEDKADDGTN